MQAGQVIYSKFGSLNPQPLQMQVCLHSASCIADKGSVMFLDTCNSFSPNRIACMVNQFSGPLFKEVESLSFSVLLFNVALGLIINVSINLGLLQNQELANKDHRKMKLFF